MLVLDQHVERFQISHSPYSVFFFNSVSILSLIIDPVNFEIHSMTTYTKMLQDRQETRCFLDFRLIDILYKTFSMFRVKNRLLNRKFYLSINVLKFFMEKRL
jgi:hypothetical protein